MKPPHKTPNKPLWIIGIVIVAIASYLLYNQWLHTADRQKFMTLKSDMLTLQQEFNRIDPGWQYSEACHAKGEKFKGDEASSCGIDIRTTYNIDIEKYKKVLERSNFFKMQREYPIEVDQQPTSNIDVSYLRNIQVVDCGMTSYGHALNKGAGFSCHASALDFYFPKNQ